MTVRVRHKKKKIHKDKKRKTNSSEVKRPRDLPRAKKQKPMDSDEAEGAPQNKSGTSSNIQPPLLPFQSGSASRSHGPSTSTTSTSSQRTLTNTRSEDESLDNDDDHGEGESGPAIQSARSQDSGRTVLYPDLCVLINDEHWTMMPEAHKYAAAGSFCFVTTKNGEQQDTCNLTTKPGVQRSLCLDEVTDDSSSARFELQPELTIKPETCWIAV